MGCGWRAGCSLRVWVDTGGTVGSRWRTGVVGCGLGKEKAVAWDIEILHIHNRTCDCMSSSGNLQGHCRGFCVFIMSGSFQIYLTVGGRWFYALLNFSPSFAFCNPYFFNLVDCRYRSSRQMVEIHQSYIWWDLLENNVWKNYKTTKRIARSHLMSTSRFQSLFTSIVCNGTWEKLEAPAQIVEKLFFASPGLHRLLFLNLKIRTWPSDTYCTTRKPSVSLLKLGERASRRSTYAAG